MVFYFLVLDQLTCLVSECIVRFILCVLSKICKWIIDRANYWNCIPYLHRLPSEIVRTVLVISIKNHC